jgi:hypothetical protein
VVYLLCRRLLERLRRKWKDNIKADNKEMAVKRGIDGIGS